MARATELGNAAAELVRALPDDAAALTIGRLVALTELRRSSPRPWATAPKAAWQ